MSTHPTRLAHPGVQSRRARGHLSGATAKDVEGQRHDVCINGRRIAYLEAGSGPRTCILIHGLAGSWDYWSHTIPALVPTHRVIAADLPGFGRSENAIAYGIADQLASLLGFLDAVGADCADVVGHSMGTLIACELAARCPDRVDRLVLTGGPVTSVIDLLRSPLRTLLANPKIATFLIEALTAGVRPPEFVRTLILTTQWARWIAFRAYVPNPTRLSAEDLARVLFGAGAPAVLPTLRQGFAYDPRAALAAVDRPTIIINGERDTICPPADADAFANSNRAVRGVYLIPNTGHLPMIEAPQEFNQHLSDFLTADAVNASWSPTC